MFLAAALFIGILFAWLGVKKGVYVMATAAFNFLISIYIGVLATPVLLKDNPVLENSSYYAAFCMLFLIAASFTVLHGVCFYLFLRQADCVFPIVFEKAGGGFFGFLIGYFLTAVLLLAVCMMPFCRHHLFQRFIPFEKMKSFSSSATCNLCHFMAGWSLEYLSDKPEKTVAYLISLGEAKSSTTDNPSEIKAAPSKIPPSGTLLPRNTSAPASKHP
ncbi:MAG TPA: hypothetical protein PLX18_08570 [Anaerohalosphaeraceae bacterium]|nr:hypothetical protein [Anaerohalosphaeraceae bacterium]HQG04960.1 hypothetical protein [Anaerohalosphaeraceae bacterium]HQI07897.1 hypothetical protein [Anaerohalosphaeraceae bacterium]HQJ68258.1 hypothetical protein [Anaerohalosphaeraceae bacterium]